MSKKNLIQSRWLFIHSFILLSILCFPIILNAQCPDYQLSFGTPETDCNELFVDVHITNGTQPVDLSGINISVNIQVGGINNSGFTFHPDTWTSVNPNLTANLSPTSSGLSLVKFPDATNETLTTSDPLFRIHLILDNANEEIDLSFQGVLAFFVQIDMTNQFCQFGTGVGAPILDYNFPTINIDGLVESPPPLQCDGSLDHGVEDVTMDIYYDTNLLCSSLTNNAGDFTCSIFDDCNSFRIIPTKESHPDCGVTLLDHQILYQHVLSIQYFTLPWQMIAADLNPLSNFGGTVSTYDLTLMGNYLLSGNISGLYDRGFRSWNFVPTTTFAFMANPITDNYTVPPFVPYILFPNSPPQFIGIKVGDLNASCSDCNSDFAPEAEEKNEVLNANLRINKTDFRVGQIVEIPVYMKGFSNQSVFGMGLKLSPDYFQVLDIQPGDIEENLNWSPNEEIVKINWFSTKREGATIDEELPLFVIKAKVLKPTSTLKGLIDLDGNSENLLFKNNSLVPRQFELDIRENNIIKYEETVDIAPNPFKDLTNITLTLSNLGGVQILIYDASAKLMNSKSFSLERGKHLIQVGDELEQGIYFCQIKTPDSSYTTRIVKIK